MAKRHRETVQLWPITVKATNLKVQTIGSVGLGYLHLSACPWPMGDEKWSVLSIDETLVMREQSLLTQEVGAGS